MCNTFLLPSGVYVHHFKTVPFLSLLSRAAIYHFHISFPLPPLMITPVDISFSPSTRESETRLRRISAEGRLLLHGRPDGLRAGAGSSFVAAPPPPPPTGPPLSRS
nr:hypothetical protein PsAHV6-068 [Psittacid alphaherpesvirus 6]